MTLHRLKIAIGALLCIALLSIGTSNGFQQAAPAKQDKVNPKDLEPLAISHVPEVPARAIAPAKELESAEERLAAACKQLRAKLTQPISLEKGIDSNTPLKDAVEFLSDRYEIPLLVNEAAFPKDENGNSVMGHPVRLSKLTGVKLGTVLRLVLAQVQGTYLIRGDHIEIVPRPLAWPSEWTADTRQLATAVTLDLHKQPLDRALQYLADASGINIILDARLAEQAANVPVTAVLTNVPVDTAASFLADMADLKVVVRYNILYVTNADNARELRADAPKRELRPQPAAPEAKPGAADPNKQKPAAPAPGNSTDPKPSKP
jgi:hypothetical protein